MFTEKSLKLSFNKEMGMKEVMGMTRKEGCRFYRNPEGHYFGRGIGYCDLGVIWSICDGDVKFCESPDVMIRSLCEEWKRGTERSVARSYP
jgi:hypothetical protein